MKQFAITIIIMLTALKGISQKNLDSSDCTCIPNPQLIEALKDRQAHKICKQERAQLQILYDLCKERLAEKDVAIDALKKLDLRRIADSSLQENEKKLLQQENQMYKIDNAGLKKQLSRARTESGLLKGAGGALLLTIGYLIIRK